MNNGKSKNGKENSYKLNEIDEALFTSYYFGFTPIKTPEILKEDVKNANSITPGGKATNACFERCAIMRTYLTENMPSLPHPVMLSYRKPLKGNGSKRANVHEYGLEILGLTGGIAEAIGIRTAASILEDEGYENLELVLNSLGDKDSIGDFEKNTMNWIRKRIDDMGADVRKAIKDNIWSLVTSPDPKFDKWRDEAPKPMNFLSETARLHFKEVLEFVESLGFPYSIRYDLIMHTECASHTIFQIITEEAGKEIVLATGFRYGKISKKIGAKREVPALGIDISYKVRNSKKKNSPNIPRPRFYLVQIGAAAKLKILNIIEALRKARIPIVHSIAKDKLSSQMASAENMKTNHILIVGQKEALEDSVTVRNMSTREQVTLQIPDLAPHLKSLR